MLTAQYILEWIQAYVIDIRFLGEYTGFDFKISWLGFCIIYFLFKFYKKVLGKVGKGGKKFSSEH